jgi:hypothetical protein
MPPVSPPMVINVKHCMVREIQWWRQNKCLGTTVLRYGVDFPNRNIG